MVFVAKSTDCLRVLELGQSSQEAPAGTRISAQVLVNGTYRQRVIEDKAGFETVLRYPNGCFTLSGIGVRKRTSSSSSSSSS